MKTYIRIHGITMFLLFLNGYVIGKKDRGLWPI